MNNAIESDERMKPKMVTVYDVFFIDKSNTDKDRHEQYHIGDLGFLEEVYGNIIRHKDFKELTVRYGHTILTIIKGKEVDRRDER